jgi:hypothetical protein
VDYNDHFYRSRLRALQGVDELVDALVSRVEQSEKLDNTYIIYTSDNGFHIGQHRLPPGKTCGFEEDIRVPLFIRGPGIAEGGVEDSVTTHIDLAPTIFELAGIPAREDFDGTAIPVTEGFSGTRHEHVTVEYWGRAVVEGDYSAIGESFLSVPSEKDILSGSIRYDTNHCISFVQAPMVYRSSLTTLTNRYACSAKGTISTTRSGATTSMNFTIYR